MEEPGYSPGGHESLARAGKEYLSPIDRLEAWQLANTSFLHAISVPEPSQNSMHCLILSRLPGYGRVADKPIPIRINS